MCYKYNVQTCSRGVKVESNIFAFYTLFFVVLASAIGVVFSSRMYVLLFAFFSLIFSTSFLYWNLGSKYIAISQFILYGIILCGYIFSLLKKSSSHELKSKFKNSPILIFSSIIVFLFALFAIIFFFAQYDNSLYSIFNVVNEKAFESIDFKSNVFLLLMVFVLLIIVALVSRVLLLEYFCESRNDMGDE